jgi:NAD-dependent SIR2 family protein deacetylase
MSPASNSQLGPDTATSSIIDLPDFVDRHIRLFILTGAGCSTASGIPDYRDANGDWKRSQPMTFQTFVSSHAARQRYWARSMTGWRRFGQVQPNGVHRALARLEALNRCASIVTQNVDRLHQAAGSTRVIDLHGRLDQIRCLACERCTSRSAFQDELCRCNPEWADLDAVAAPDGDADLGTFDFAAFVVPPCGMCGGVLKPDVVFFGETVPTKRREAAMRHLAEADAMLIVGSSLMVYSGFRFVQAAASAGKPIAAVNLGRTRADTLLSLKVEEPCEAALAFLLELPDDI